MKTRLLRRPKRIPLKTISSFSFSHVFSDLRCYSSGQQTNQNQNQNQNTETSICSSDNQDRDCSFRLHKSRGQHLLINPKILDTIVHKSEIRPSDTILEIGPGTGNLTLRLVETAKKVIAVEIDNRMVEVLHKRVIDRGLHDKLCVIREDALKTELPRFDAVVANIPYGISSPLVIKLLYGKNPFRSATLLLQKEFARRMLAGPGDSQFNRLAVNVKLLADVELVMDVSKRFFLPCPNVDSSVIILRPKAEPPGVDLAEWRAFTRALFCNKNKTLGASFKQMTKVMQLLSLSDYCDNEVKLFKDKMVQILRDNGFEQKRPFKMSMEELLHLLALFNHSGIFFSS